MLYRYRGSWKGNNFRESNQEKKQRTDTINEEARLRRLRAITLQEEKRKIQQEIFQNKIKFII